MSEDTPAISEVASSGVSFRVVRTERAGSAEESAALVPGGRQIDWPLLRAHLAVSRLSLPDQEEAKEATGYERGAITPFASTTTWPVVADATLTGPAPVAIGAGAHGVNLHLDPADLVRLLDADVAAVTRAAN